MYIYLYNIHIYNMLRVSSMYWLNGNERKRKNYSVSSERLLYGRPCLVRSRRTLDVTRCSLYRHINVLFCPLFFSQFSACIFVLFFVLFFCSLTMVRRWIIGIAVFHTLHSQQNGNKKCHALDESHARQFWL